LDPSSVETCALPLTYGICSPAPYSPSLHSSYHNNSSETVPLFRAIISRGQLVHINTIYSTTVKVDYPEQEELEVKLYTSKKENVTYCDEEEVQLYGTLTVDLPDTEYGLDREIDIQLFVGDVSMTVTAYNKKKGEPYESAFELNKCALNELLS
ncbi:1067_t:CDS:2, partial [Paraglomus occultum]